MPLHYCFCLIYRLIDFFFSVQKCLKKVYASANRLKQKYCRIPFAIPASEIRFKLKEMTCTCGTKNIEKNGKKTWKMDE